MPGLINILAPRQPERHQGNVLNPSTNCRPREHAGPGQTKQLQATHAATPAPPRKLSRGKRDDSLVYIDSA